MSKNILKNLSLPVGKKNLLLHSCCAPCSGDIMKRLLRLKYKLHGLFL